MSPRASAPIAHSRIDGRWRIVQMDLWDMDAIDLVQPGYIEFDGRDGRFGFIVVGGGMDCVHSSLDELPHAAFRWEGSDEGDPVSGRGWATQLDGGSLEGQICFHLDDDSGFVARRDVS